MTQSNPIAPDAGSENDVRFQTCEYTSTRHGWRGSEFYFSSKHSNEPVFRPPEPTPSIKNRLSRPSDVIEFRSKPLPAFPNAVSLVHDDEPNCSCRIRSRTSVTFTCCSARPSEQMNTGDSASMRFGCGSRPWLPLIMRASSPIMSI